MALVFQLAEKNKYFMVSSKDQSYNSADWTDLRTTVVDSKGRAQVANIYYI